MCNCLWTHSAKVPRYQKNKACSLQQEEWETWFVFKMELVKSNKDITDMAACIGKDQTMVRRSCLMEFPSDAVSLSLLLKCWCIWWEHQQVGGKMTVSCIKLWSFSRTWLICLEEMNPWQGFHHWAVLNNTQDEILAPVKLVEDLPLISVRPGFHPGSQKYMHGFRDRVAD